ncbi:MAG: response regulator transcription factor [Phaeodactylibacter sp.]|nr:response regulator transcription factor [Phaeodactylibacter sp.]
MRLLIVEDEHPAAKRLSQLLLQMKPAANICGVLDSIESTVNWLSNNPKPDLAFFDIQLGDGLSFDIFQQTDFSGPVIFTTAYDQYTLKAFKQDSVDYLLKPIEEEELEQALRKFERRQHAPSMLTQEVVQSLLAGLSQPKYQSRFIIKIGQQLSYIATEEIQYFYAEEGVVFAQLEGKKRHALDYTLDALAPLLDPASFFRISRKVITNIKSVRKVAPLFNGRLLVSLWPSAPFEVTVSRDRATAFKRWLGA